MGGVLLAVLGAESCGTTPTSPGGLEVIIGTNLETPQTFDSIGVQISQRTASGGWNRLLRETHLVPDEIKLPTRYSIEGGSSPDQDALIQVTAMKGGVTVVERDVQVQVPTTWVAELDLVLAAMCAGTACAPGESCQPTTGACASDVILTSTLSPYRPGDSLDAGPLVVIGANDASVASDAPAASDASAGSDASDSGPTDGADGTVGVCMGGSHQCSGNSLQTCGAGGNWSAGVPCTKQACVGGQCVGACAPGSTICSGGTGQQTCAASGSWGTTQPCTVTCLSNSCQTIKAISVGSGFQTCALMSAGTVQCWGYDLDGEVGNGTSQSDTATPSAVENLTGATVVSAGGAFTCALVAGGAVWCWGSNSLGQLGTGTTTGSDVPVQVSGLSGVTAITAGSSHACALQSNGSVSCWGENDYGALGNGSTTGPDQCVQGSSATVCSTTPVQVQGVTTAVAIGAGQNFSCALLSNQTVQCWGEGAFGNLGNGGTSTSATPVAVLDVAGASAIAVGNGTACALLSGGTVDCWGSDYYAQLGNGTANETVSTPAPIAGLSGVTAISMGFVGGCALLGNGTVDCWGDNTDGEIGTGSTTGPETCMSGAGPFECANVPTPVSSLTGVTAISTGGDASCALLSSGNAVCWGYGGDGSLGNNSFASAQSTPAPVMW